MNPLDASPSGSLELSSATIEAIARRVVELQRTLPLRTTSDVLTLAEAITYAKKGSKSSFWEWCVKWDVKPRTHGRYSRARLDLALEREAGTAHTPASIRRQQLARAAA